MRNRRATCCCAFSVHLVAQHAAQKNPRQIEVCGIGHIRLLICYGLAVNFKFAVDLLTAFSWRFGLDGNVVGRINEVNRRRPRLVLGWVTVSRRVNHLGM